MKLICVEEHALDAAIGAASQAYLRSEAPYLPDWGSRVVDGRQVADSTRPHVIAPAESARKALDMGETRLADMDAAGISMQVLSYGGSPQLLPAGTAIELTRAANDRLALAAQAHPTRFAGIRHAPMAGARGSRTRTGARGERVGPQGRTHQWPSRRHFPRRSSLRPILAAFDELNVPLYVHPGLTLPAVQAPYYGGFERELSARLAMFAWGWHNEAGIQVVRMLLAGVFDRYPRLQVISGHWGEMVPVLSAKTGGLHSAGSLWPRTPHRADLSRACALIAKRHADAAALSVHPHADGCGTNPLLHRLSLSEPGRRASLHRALPVSDADNALIAHGNAERLLGL